MTIGVRTVQRAATLTLRALFRALCTWRVPHQSWVSHQPRARPSSHLDLTNAPDRDIGTVSKKTTQVAQPFVPMGMVPVAAAVSVVPPFPTICFSFDGGCRPNTKDINGGGKVATHHRSEVIVFVLILASG